MGGVSRILRYGHNWPVPGFVGLRVAQALALADETGIELLLGGSGAPLTGNTAGQVVSQQPSGTTPKRPSQVTVWLTGEERDG